MGARESWSAVVHQGEDPRHQGAVLALSGFPQHIPIPPLPWECRAGQLGVQGCEPAGTGSCRRGCTGKLCAGCPRPHSTSVGLS